MSLGSIIGGIVGAIAGFFLGGPYGAVYGAAIGMGVGYLVDPMKMPQPGKPQLQDFQTSTTKEGLVIPDLLGTTKCTGNLLYYWGATTSEIKQKSGGKGGGGKDQVTGYKYYLSFQLGLCLGPVDAVFSIYKEQDCIWTGFVQHTSADYETINVENYGKIYFYFGTSTQTAVPDVASFIPDPTLNVPYRNLCYAYFENFYLGEANRCPTYSFVINKSPSFAFNSYCQIKSIEYNPAHAIYYILHYNLGLPTSFLDEESFSDTADLLYQEEFGIGIYMSQSVDALGWLQNILRTINGMLYYREDGKLHLKLDRPLGNIENLFEVDESLLVEPLEIARAAWLDTINQIRVLYPYRLICETKVAED